jgi:hypothetical protein
MNLVTVGKEHPTMTISRRRHMLASAALLISAVPGARADMGIPMLAVMWPASWLLLVPVIFVEGWAATRILSVRFREGLRLATTANLFSTILGIPITWVIMLVLSGLIGPNLGDKPYSQWARAASDALGSVWVFPDDPTLGWQGWMVTRAAMILCVPFFFMSVAVEGWVVKTSVSKDTRPLVWRWAWQANLVSYGLIEVGLGVMLVLALRR